MPLGMSPLTPSIPIHNQCPSVFLHSHPPFRSITNAPRYVSNHTLHPDPQPKPLGISPLTPSIPIHNQCPSVCLHSHPPFRSITNAPRYFSTHTLHSDP